MAFYKAPGFSFDKTSTGIFSRRTDEDVIKDSLSQIILSGIGERAMRRDFGCGIHGAIFENMGSFLADVVADYVITAIRRNEPRVNVKDVIVEFDEDKGMVDVLIEYLFNGRPDRTRITLEKQI